MASQHLLASRLHRQQLLRPRRATPVDVVRWFGAMQAQDPLGALWALGLRTLGTVDSDIEASLSDGSILRTHVFRWTWQYVASADLRWMLGLVGERLMRAAAGRNHDLGLEPRILRRSLEVVARALEGGNHLTRAELALALGRSRIPCGDGRLSHLLGHAELAGIICSGGRRGNHRTFALLDERVPRAAPLARDEALVHLATRYFQSRGPATDRDFAWWTGLPLGEVRRAIGLAGATLEARALGGVTYYQHVETGRSTKAGGVHLLPPFDEYLIAYQDRSAMVEARHARRVNGGGGLLNPVVVINGEVRAVWKRTLEREAVRIVVAPFRPLCPAEADAIRAAADRYGRFLGLEAKVAIRRR